MKPFLRQAILDVEESRIREVANAGMGGGGAKAFHDLEPEAWRRVMGVNLDGVFFTLQQALQLAEEGAAFGTLDDAVIVGTGDRHHLAEAEHGAHFRRDAHEFGREVHGAGGDDATLARHEAAWAVALPPLRAPRACASSARRSARRQARPTPSCSRSNR